MNCTHSRLQWRNWSPPLQAPSRRPSLLSKLTLALATSSYLLTTVLTTFMSDRQVTKTVISSAYAETFILKQPEKRTPCRAGFAVPSLSVWSSGSQASTQRRGDRGQPCRTDRSSVNASERSPFTCTTASGLWYNMLIHLQNSGLIPAVSKTIAKNRWSTLSKALNWSKLISVIF